MANNQSSALPIPNGLLDAIIRWQRPPMTLSKKKCGDWIPPFFYKKKLLGSSPFKSTQGGCFFLGVTYFLRQKKHMIWFLSTRGRIYIANVQVQKYSCLNVKFKSVYAIFWPPVNPPEYDKYCSVFFFSFNILFFMNKKSPTGELMLHSWTMLNHLFKGWDAIGTPLFSCSSLITCLRDDGTTLQAGRELSEATDKACSGSPSHSPKYIPHQPPVGYFVACQMDGGPKFDFLNVVLCNYFDPKRISASKTPGQD